MAITIDWGNSIINVNKADMLLVQSTPSEIYQLDLNEFRLALKDLEDSSDGMAFLRTHRHNTTVTVGGASLARVIEIINGYTVTFEDGQYRVETVGANSNIGSVINVNQVSVSTSNSAGLQDLNSLQAASYGGVVSVDPNTTFTGTSFPTGTGERPVNNMADALSIATERGINTFKIINDLTLTSGDYSNGNIFYGRSPNSVTLTVDSAADVSNCTFQNLTLQGTLDNGNIARECSILDLNNINGFMFHCSLNGIITLGGGVQANIYSCYSQVAGGSLTPTIDLGGSGQGLALRDYSGGLKLTNHTGNEHISLDFESGQLIIDPTVSSGAMVVRGICKITDNSTGTAAVVDETVTSKLNEIFVGVEGALTTSQFLGLK